MLNTYEGEVGAHLYKLLHVVFKWFQLDQKVDIISMSVTMHPSAALERAVGSAKKDNIVIFGRKGGRENNRQDVYPADYNEVISISSLTQFGKGTDSTETNAQYFFHEENVTIPAESSYLESQHQVSGSSVATALAADIGAPVLSCRRIGNEDKEMDRVKTVKTVFEHMAAEDKQAKYVQPWKVFKDQRTAKLQRISWLKAYFANEACFAVHLRTRCTLVDRTLEYDLHTQKRT